MAESPVRRRRRSAAQGRVQKAHAIARLVVRKLRKKRAVHNPRKVHRTPKRAMLAGGCSARPAGTARSGRSIIFHPMHERYRLSEKGFSYLRQKEETTGG